MEKSINLLRKIYSHHEMPPPHPEPMAFPAVPRVGSMVFLVDLPLMDNKKAH
jgi:hypothetical protein